MDLHLRDKVALVTGGSLGLGRTICLRLAAEGARVAVNHPYRDDEARAVVEQIRRTCEVEALAVAADVSREEEVCRMFREIDQTFSRIDILVNNAAVCPTGPVKDMSEETWIRTLRVNLTGTFLTSREMVRRLLAAGRPGRIVNIASVAAFKGSTTGHAPYDASKGGIVTFTVSLAREVAPQGIAVNAVAPGMMYTEMTAKTLDANLPKYLERIPLGRVGTTDEIANVVLFLASDASSYVTGATFDASGGLLMR